MRQMLKEQKTGFSVLEVVVAISIVSVGMLGVMSLVTYSLKTQIMTKNFVTASMLAQEGIELTRNRRDTNWIDIIFNNNNLILYDDGISNGTASYKFKIDYYNSNPTLEANIDNARLYLDASGFYDHDNGGTPTPFYRLIEVDGTNPEFLDVTCRVRWSSGGQYREYVAETELYDWLTKL